MTNWLTLYTGRAEEPLVAVTAASGDGASQLHFTYLVGPHYCGSGGCNLLIHRIRNGSVETLGELTLVRPPVRVLETTSHGLPDVAVMVAGGGVEPHQAVLAFDGAAYPSNPTVPPARSATAPLGGQAVITEAMVRLAQPAP